MLTPILFNRKIIWLDMNAINAYTCLIVMYFRKICFGFTLFLVMQKGISYLVWNNEILMCTTQRWKYFFLYTAHVRELTMLNIRIQAYRDDTRVLLLLLPPFLWILLLHTFSPNFTWKKVILVRNFILSVSRLFESN